MAAVPAKGADWAFLSSGTWSLLGVVTRRSVTSPEAFSTGVVNEMTLEGYFLLRGIMGLGSSSRCVRRGNGKAKHIRTMTWSDWLSILRKPVR